MKSGTENSDGKLEVLLTRTVSAIDESTRILNKKNESKIEKDVVETVANLTSFLQARTATLEISRRPLLAKMLANN